MKVGLINRYYPPYFSTTGRYANLLSEHFIETYAFDMHIFTQKGNYSTSRHTPDLPFGKVHYVTGLHTGRHKFLRLIFGFISSFLLMIRARMARCQFYIVMSDPPFNNFVASLILKKNSYAFWTMDLYPEAFVSAGLISENNPLYRFYRLAIRSSQPAFVIALGKGQASELKHLFPRTKLLSYAIGLTQNTGHDIETTDWYDKEKFTFAYIGNIGEAHDEIFITQFAKALDPGRHVLIISVYGSKKNLIIQELIHLPAVKIIDNISDSALRWIDVQMVSLKSEWTHICVPSKALYGMSLGSAILFQGLRESDAWEYVKDCGWHISENYRSSGEINKFLNGLSGEEVVKKKKQISGIIEQLKNSNQYSLEQIGRLITQTDEK